mmetsp:Transcript_18045/g.46818  ORF Transcript_18045/g.46818 Transcript_18045/m.46818 type:complete len:211 (-) Transcript_18045:87-719(-)
MPAADSFPLMSLGSPSCQFVYNTGEKSSHFQPLIPFSKPSQQGDFAPHNLITSSFCARLARQTRKAEFSAQRSRASDRVTLSPKSFRHFDPSWVSRQPSPSAHGIAFLSRWQTVGFFSVGFMSTHVSLPSSSCNISVTCPAIKAGATKLSKAMTHTKARTFTMSCADLSFSGWSKLKWPMLDVKQPQIRRRPLPLLLWPLAARSRATATM